MSLFSATITKVTGGRVDLFGGVGSRLLNSALIQEVKADGTGSTVKYISGVADDSYPPTTLSCSDSVAAIIEYADENFADDLIALTLDDNSETIYLSTRTIIVGVEYSSNTLLSINGDKPKKYLVTETIAEILALAVTTTSTTSTSSTSTTTTTEQPFPLDRNEDIVEAGGYVPVADSGGVDFNSASTGRSYFNYAHETRIRQNGSITKVSMYIPNAADWANITSYYFQVWRKDGATYDVVSEEDIASKLTPNQINTVTLDTPIEVQEGDHTGIYIGGDVDDSCYAFSGYTNGLRYDSGSKVSTTNYDWDGESALAYAIPIEVYMQAPLMVGIGDSLIAGHGDHYSFLENTNTTDVENQIMYQLNQLDSNIVYQNMGIGGENSTEVEARFTEDVVDLKPKYCVLLVGVNDLAQSVAKSTYIAKMTAMLDEMDTEGIVPIVCKVLPWSNGTNTQMQTRDDWMSDLQTLVGTYSGAVWVDSDSAVGEFRTGGDANNLWDIQAAYDDDGVHLNEAGYTKVAETIYAVIS